MSWVFPSSAVFRQSTWNNISPVSGALALFKSLLLNPIQMCPSQFTLGLKQIFQQLAYEFLGRFQITYRNRKTETHFELRVNDNF